MSTNIFKLLFTVTSLVILSACSTAPLIEKSPAEPPAAPPPRSQAPVVTPPPAATEKAEKKTTAKTAPPVTKPAAVPANPAVLALLSDAEQYQQQGNLPAAQSRLQRAQRIAPRDPKVYYQLAQTHYELEDYRLAEQVALKGISYAQGDNAQQKRFWLLLADIRTKAGDHSAAKVARKQAEQL